MLTAIFADVLARTREKLGVQGLRGDQMLLELRDRIRAQGKLPELGEGWDSSVVLKPAGGSSFGGDFVVSACDGKTLEVALVDVSGKGIDAGTRALLLSGAFGGLLGSVPREEFLPACNAYLRRGAAAGGLRHRRPPVARPGDGGVRDRLGRAPARGALRRGQRRWRDRPGARHRARRGRRPARCGSRDRARRAAARRRAMLYTDGLVEAPGRDIDAGTDRPARRGRAHADHRFQGRRGRPGRAMQREIGGSDDCALVLIWRTLA